MAVGFIGLGNIGKPMAKHLLKLAEPVWVYDVARPPLDELAALGASVADDAGVRAEQCHTIGVCVRDDNDVEALLRGARGLLELARPDTVIAIHSTVTQAAMLRWVELGSARGIHIIDAPITGGAAGAEAASLCYMVGGDERIVARCTPVFATSGSKVVHCGKPGTGIALKLCNNLMAYAAFTAMYEANKLAEACGLSLEKLKEVGEANGVVTPQMRAFIDGQTAVASQGKDALNAVFGPTARLGSKDLDAALASASQLQLDLPVTRHLRTLIEAVFLRGY